MKTNDKLRLWRVDMVNRRGYRAQYYFIEAEPRNIHQEVRNQKYRLLDFPETWSYSLTKLEKEFDEKRKKWM